MLHDVTKKVLKPGDDSQIFLDGTVISGKIIETTVVNFLREYKVEIATGQFRWLIESDFSHKRN